MAHITTTTVPDLTSVLTTWLNKNFVRDLEFTLQHQKLCEKAVIPKGAGKIGRFLSFSPPTKAKGYAGAQGGDGTAAITEGSVTANEFTGVPQTSTDITIAEFGEYTKFGTLYEYAAISGTREKVLKRLRDGAAYCIDAFVRNKTVTSTNILTAYNNQIGGLATVGGTLGNVVAPNNNANAALLIQARKLLFDAEAAGFDGIEGVPRGHYGAVITPKQEMDIVTEITTSRIYWSNAVVNVPGPMGQEKFINGYIGSIYQVAVLVTNNYTTTAVSAVTCDIGFVYADGGVGAMAFGDMQPEIIINDLNSPYKNMNTFAWHSMFGAGLIDGNRVVKLYSIS